MQMCKITHLQFEYILCDLLSLHRPKPMADAARTRTSYVLSVSNPCTVIDLLELDRELLLQTMVEFILLFWGVNII